MQGFLIPTLKDFFGAGRSFSKAYMPLNGRSSLKNDDAECPVNENGIPCCPHDPDLPMKAESFSVTKAGIKRYKFSCPKVAWEKGDDGKYRRHCQCDNPCTSSACGRMIYRYPEKDLRAYPGVLRGTDEWEST